MEKLLRKCWKMKALWCQMLQKKQSKKWNQVFDAFFSCTSITLFYQSYVSTFWLKILYDTKGLLNYCSNCKTALRIFYTIGLLLMSRWVWFQATFSRYLKFCSVSVYMRSDSVCEENIFLIHQNVFLEVWKLFLVHWPRITQ